jgi:hypothetical protein
MSNNVARISDRLLFRKHAIMLNIHFSFMGTTPRQNDENYRRLEQYYSSDYFTTLSVSQTIRRQMEGCRNCGSHSRDYKEFCLRGYNAVWRDRSCTTRETVKYGHEP